MSDEFNRLLDRHLQLSERIRQVNPEQARTEIERLVADIDVALDSGTVTGPSARRMAMFAGQWRTHLATTKGSSTPVSTSDSIERLPLFVLLRSMSTTQYWKVGGALVIVLVGAAAIGRYEAMLTYEQKLNAATIETASQKARADTATSQLEAATKRLEPLSEQVDLLGQERLLLALIARIRDSSNRAEALAARKQLATLIEDMQKASRVVAWYASGVQKIEIKRTSEVWSVGGK
jgi:hypothetical protein